MVAQPAGQRPRIGIFDSGVGGLTVLAALRLKLPHADFVYYGDTANLPYGTKSAAQVTKLSVACTRSLKSRDVQAIVVACNTASSLALDAIQEEAGEIPVFGVVEPGVLATLDALTQMPSAEDGSPLAPVLVLATRATIRSGAYGRTIRDHLNPDFLGDRLPCPIIEQECPLLVPMIEEGWTDHPVLHETIQEYVRPHLTETPGVALLGCTHYPWIQSAFERALPGWSVVNSAQAVANFVTSAEPFASARKNPENLGKGVVQSIFSDPDAIPKFAKHWLDAGI